MPRPACVYLPLEPVQSRYTFDLCNEDDGWMTKCLRTAAKWRQFFYINPVFATMRKDINKGAVLDAYTRSAYSMRQCIEVCALLDAGLLKNDDILYLQDFWTPGLEAILYTAHLCNVRLRIYAMVHAQSVDQYDFTYAMRSWMRPVEIGYANAMSGLFVASSVHKEQLELAGVTAPIHVVSLPYDRLAVQAKYMTRYWRVEKAVIYTSRLDQEKDPQFMMQVAVKFLEKHPEWEWWVTTSAKEFRSYNNPEAVKDLKALARANPRFKLFKGLSKQDYHDRLSHARIQFNSAKQDYVSWTLIEAVHHGCWPVYPAFRSFPECLPVSSLYNAGSVHSAVACLTRATNNPPSAQGLPVRERVLSASHFGLQAIARIVSQPHNPCARPANVWDAEPR